MPNHTDSPVARITAGFAPGFISTLLFPRQMGIAQLSGAKCFFHRHVDGVVLMIPGHFLRQLAITQVFERDEISNQIKEPVFCKHTFQHNLQFSQIWLGVIFACNGSPGLLMLIVAHSAADAPYPFARMVIYCWPLLVFTMCLLIERFHTGKMVLRLFSTLLLLFSLIIVIQSGLQFDMDHFGWLEYSAGTKQAARIIRDREADSPREVSISTSWSLYACLNY
jgi:hypothetical protein